MRAVLLLVLFSLPAAAQVFPGGGGGMCTLDGTQVGVATYFRSTDATGTVNGFACDAINPQCLDLGPGSRNMLGTNVAGDILLGPGSGNTTVVRNFGDYIGLGITGTNLTASAAFILGSSAFLVNSTGAKPVLVNDADGFQVTCKTAITTCTSALENSEIPVCGTGGALTKRCVCMGDGTTYAWRNLFNLAAGAGTTTTCPAT